MAVFSYVKEGKWHSLIRGKKKKYTNHDQLFKELIHNYFAEFLEAFFPDVHAGIDFESVKPFSEELSQFHNVLNLLQ